MALNIPNPFKKTPPDDGPADSMDASKLLSDYAESTMDEGSPLFQGESSEELRVADEPVTLPLLGTRTPAAHQRLLGSLLVLSLLAQAFMVYWTVSQSNKVASQVSAVEQVLMESQRLAKSATQAMLGSERAFGEVRESSADMSKDIKGLRDGDANLSKLGGGYASELNAVAPLVDKAVSNANAILGQQTALLAADQALRQLRGQSANMLDVAEAVFAQKLQQAATPAELSAASELATLTQRIGKSSSDLLTAAELNPEAITQLGRDYQKLGILTSGLLNGSGQLRLLPARDEQTRERLNALARLHGNLRTSAEAVLNNGQGLASAHLAQVDIQANSEELRQNLENLKEHLANNSGLNFSRLLLLLLPALLTLLSALGLARVQLIESRRRELFAEQQRHAAEMQQQEGKRVNDANQAAILRLMNELQTVAEGDLTQEATVTEDITGAIADSVNYTVEELRSLVGNVQSTATRVAQTTSTVEATSAELLTTSTQQLHEIRATGQSVLDMAVKINEVSAQAQESAAVARQSLQAAETGLTAVQNTIGGMNSIRDQIQETSKRIKRLGESSQEIGEITELIADITEQTNVLALNAAIQAASAGEAGRGFSVVAEEVQRLAERSGDATRQIATLVKAIQTDTQDAVAAMERSTQGVVEGARLSDNAGAALSEIDRVSRRLAELIEQISDAALKEANQANDVASNIQHAFAVTEQTGESTRTTVNQVRDLARMADELRQSVARFKIA